MTTKTAAKTIFERILALDLSECEVTVCLASSLKDEVVPHFEKLLLSEELTQTFRSVAAFMQARSKKDYRNGNLVLRNYALESKPDPYEIEYLELPSYAHIMEQIGPLSALADVEVFQANEKFVSGIRFYVIAAQPPEGDPVYFFRAYSPKKMLGRSRFFAMVFSDGIYDRVTEPMFLFDHIVDCISSGDMMFIYKKDHFQEIFRFFELVRKVAKETLETIRATVPIQNFEEFARDCEGHLMKLVKLRNIAAKPYWGKITMENIKKVIKRNNLAVQIVRTGPTEMLVYNPADKWVLLKLLDDDYLLSLMTEQTYEVTGKREVEHQGG